MGRKWKRKAQQARQAPELSAKQVEQRLLATSFPRLHMLLILSLAALGTFLSSATLVHCGLESMGVRYLIAIAGGYAYFLLLVRVWIAWQTRNWSFGRRPRGEKSALDAPSDVPDLSALGDLGGSADGFSGGGGAFGGAGASASWGEAAPSEASSELSLDGVGSADEGIAIVIAIVAVLGGLIALGVVVYSSPVLFAEVLLDVAVLGAVYKKNKKHVRGHWAAGVLRRTYKPALVLGVFAAIFGFAIQTLAPTQITLGAVLREYQIKSQQRPGARARADSLPKSNDDQRTQRTRSVRSTRLL